VIIRIIKNTLWILPFIAFLFGYMLLNNMYKSQEIQTPPLVGQRLATAFETLSRHNLTPRILATKQNLDIPEGTILSQTPAAGKKIKEKQSVLLVISTQPKQQTAPTFYSRAHQTIVNECAALDIRNKSYYLQGKAPQETCIAQLPVPGQLMHDNNLITYLCAGNTKPILWPNLKNKSVAEVLEFLQMHGLKADVTHSELQDEDHQCTRCVVSDQRPLAGSILSLNPDKPIYIQLQVSPTL